MRFTRSMPHLRSLKFAPVAAIAFFFFTNLGGVFFSPVLAPSVRANPIAALTGILPTSGDPTLDSIILSASEREGIDPRFTHAVIWQESRYQPRAVSHAGAQGLMQLMPDTAKRFGCHDSNDTAANLKAGTKYLAWLLKRFNGNIELALAGYNAGEGAVDKYQGIPPYKETQNYVRKITARYGETYHPIPTPNSAMAAFDLSRGAAEALVVE
jgi:soluble lytic murein transglycosylase-like protein